MSKSLLQGLRARKRRLWERWCFTHGHRWQPITVGEVQTAQGLVYVVHARCKRCGWLEGS